LEWSLVVDRLDELLVLTTILDAGILAAAARRLRRSPPAMTRSLAACPSISLFRPRDICRERFVRFLTSRRRR